MDEKGQFNLVLRIYNRIIWLSHGALIVALISGFYLSTRWLSLWFIIVVLIWVLLGTLLVMTSKMIRVILEKMASGTEAVVEIAKLRVYSLLLTLAVIAMFTVKIINFI